MSFTLKVAVLRSNFECLFSMPLLPGSPLARPTEQERQDARRPTLKKKNGDVLERLNGCTGSLCIRRHQAFALDPVGVQDRSSYFVVTSFRDLAGVSRARWIQTRHW